MYTGEYNPALKESEILAEDHINVPSEAQESGEEAQKNDEDNENETETVHQQSERLMFLY